MPDLDLSAIETKLAAARTRLILDKPFLGALVLRLPLEAADPEWCPTTGTDARKLYYNPGYIGSLTLEQTQFMLAHDALHCALSHFARRQHRVKHRWDLACDYAINPLLIEDGLKPPYDAQIMDEFKGMTAEEIYPMLKDNENTETLDQHLYDQNSEGGESDDQSEEQQETPKQQSAPNQPSDKDEPGGKPPPLSQEERQNLQVQWQQRLAGAAQQAMQAGKLSGSLRAIIEHLLQPQLPWRMLLARYLSLSARDDYSYMRPSRRSSSDALFPALHSAQVDLAVAVDTSGSVHEGEISEFLAEVSAIKGQIRARIALLACDSQLAEGMPLTFEAWEDLDLPIQLGGGGGTDFRPVFEWMDKQQPRPQTLVYFTDAQGRFPELEPDFPVIWLVKGKTKVPWGQRIQLN